MQRTYTALLVALAAVGLTWIFWGPLWRGGGFIGGDVGTYYYPQKSFYAERLQDGEFPLWNNRTGHGYPLVAESQTGAFYPFNVILYRAFDVNTAYNVSHLLHYVLAFTFAWMYARKLDLSPFAALLAALVYTYGWFPTRSCLEWAIVGGAYFPLALWCVESFLQTRRWRYPIGLSLALALQMLAGHFNLAFITQLVLAAYIPLRLWLAKGDLPSQTVRVRGRCATIIVASMLVGFALAAVQLLPTWELKLQSQRASVGTHFDPGYGHIPPLYWSQIVGPWLWASGDINLDQLLEKMKFLAISSGTNKVEAHLYFGMIPLALLIWALLGRAFGKSKFDRRLWVWVILALAASIYSTGWLLPLTRHFPGFSFFMGPGRYGMVITLAVALIVGSVFGQLLTHLRKDYRGLLLAIAVFGLTIVDLRQVSRLVTYAYLLDNPPIKALPYSGIRHRLASAAGKPRLYAPGANLPNLLGVAQTPVYLGLGPAVYYDPKLVMPKPPPSENPEAFPPATDEQIRWLQRAGVTHVLSFRRLDLKTWPVRSIRVGADAFLNRAWGGRRLDEPLFLYELKGSRGRVTFAESHPGDVAKVTEYRANRVRIDADSKTGGRLVLTDLMYPGWKATVDGQPATAIEFEKMYRAVELTPGPHTVVWTYQPRSVYWGAVLSVVSFLLLATVAMVRYCFSGRLRFLEKGSVG
jgi:hypothetical protein